MFAVSARCTLTAHAQHANIQATTVVCFRGSVDTTFTCTASSSGSSKSLPKANVQCAARNSSGLASSTTSRGSRWQNSLRCRGERKGTGSVCKTNGVCHKHACTGVGDE